jgi:hypothetical protein
MKQTAVEWFAEKVEQHLLTFGSIQPNVLSKFKQQAKEMEKQQTFHDYEKGWNDCNDLKYNPMRHYNETYGGPK